MPPLFFILTPYPSLFLLPLLQMQFISHGIKNLTTGRNLNPIRQGAAFCHHSSGIKFYSLAQGTTGAYYRIFNNGFIPYISIFPDHRVAYIGIIADVTPGPNYHIAFKPNVVTAGYTFPQQHPGTFGSFDNLPGGISFNPLL